LVTFSPDKCGFYPNAFSREAVLSASKGLERGHLLNLILFCTLIEPCARPPALRTPPSHEASLRFLTWPPDFCSSLPATIRQTTRLLVFLSTPAKGLSAFRPFRNVWRRRARVANSLLLQFRSSSGPHAFFSNPGVQPLARQIRPLQFVPFRPISLRLLFTAKSR